MSITEAKKPSSPEQFLESVKRFSELWINPAKNFSTDSRERSSMLALGDDPDKIWEQSGLKKSLQDLLSMTPVTSSFAVDVQRSMLASFTFDFPLDGALENHLGVQKGNLGIFNKDVAQKMEKDVLKNQIRTYSLYWLGFLGEEDLSEAEEKALSLEEVVKRFRDHYLDGSGRLRNNWVILAIRSQPDQLTHMETIMWHLPGLVKWAQEFGERYKDDAFERILPNLTPFLKYDKSKKN